MDCEKCTCTGPKINFEDSMTNQATWNYIPKTNYSNEVRLHVALSQPQMLTIMHHIGMASKADRSMLNFSTKLTFAALSSGTALTHASTPLSSKAHSI